MKARYVNPYTDFGFKKLFGEEGFRNAEIANYSQKELQEYEESLKVYRDMKAVIDTSFNDGVKSGRMEVAKNLKLQSIDADIISKSTGLTVEEIDKL